MPDPNTVGETVAVPNAAPAPGNSAPNMVPISALHEEREKRQAMNTELEALRAQLSAASVQNTPQAAPVQTYEESAPNTRALEELDYLWRENPRAAMQKELMLAMTWRDQVEENVSTQMANMAATHKDFNTYRDEVQKQLRRLPIEQRTKPGVIEAAFYMVRGKQAESLGKTEAEKALNKYKAGEGISGSVPGASSGGGTPNSTGLSIEEKSAAAALGISEQEYMKHKK